MRTRLVVILVILSAALTAQQTGVRRATNVESLAGFPAFYHLRSVLVAGTVAQQSNGDIAVSDGAASVRIITRGSAPDGLNEVRGEFWDLGRMNPDDPRLAAYDVKS